MQELQAEPTSKKHPIPQNVMDVEFKLIGNLTLRQFLYLLIGSIFTFLTYKTINVFPFKFLIPFLIGGSAVGIAFVPLEDRGLDQWVISFFTAIYSPTQRVWRKTPQPPLYLLTDYANILASEIVSIAPVRSRAQLTDYLKRMEPEEKDELLEKKEHEFFSRLGLDKIQPREKPVPPSPKKGEPSPKPTIRYKEKKQAPAQKALPTPPPPEPRPRQPITQTTIATEATVAQQPVIKVVHPDKRPEFIPAIKNIRPGRSLSQDKLKSLPGLTGEIVLPIRGETVIASETDTTPSPPDQDQTAALLQELTSTIKAARTSLAAIKGSAPPLPSAPTTSEDMFTIPEFQRQTTQSQLKKFTAQLGQLKEKQRAGEKNLEKTIAYYEEQIANLKKQLEQVEKKPAPKPGEELARRVEELKKQSRILQHQLETVQTTINKLKEQVKESSDTKQLDFIKQQEQLLVELSQSKQDYEKRIEKLVQSLKAQTRTPTPSPTPAAPITKAPASGPFTSSKPNIVYGTVRSRDGHLLENAVIIIKDPNNEPVRALKTNKLGQFKITTPLPNNTYRLEVTKSEHSFGPTEVKLQGGVLGELEVIEG